jgi:transposase
VLRPGIALLVRSTAAVARRGAIKVGIQARAQLDALILTAPEPVRAPLRKLTSKQRIRAWAVLRPGSVSDPVSAVKTALRALARRWQPLQDEIDDLDAQLTPLVTAAAPALMALPGVGAETVGQLLVTAGGQPRPAPLRSVVRPGVRGRPDPGVFRTH